MPRPPKGNNKLGSRDAFRERDYYKRFVYPTTVPLPFDLWEEAHLQYGRVDDKGNGIMVREDALAQLVSSKGTSFALNFVTNAFRNFKAYYENAALAGKISSTTSILVEPRRGWMSVNEGIHRQSQMLYSVFRSEYLSMAKVFEDITDFSKFIKHFLSFISGLPKGTPVTRTSFIYSKLASPATSGLTIELAREDHSDDFIKYRKFIQDPNFPFYARAAKRFGFLIDKNAPWRIVADIQSPEMQSYMRGVGVEPEDMFEYYYFNSCDHDIEGLQMYFKAFYDNYRSQNPTVSQVRHRKGGGTCVRVVDRMPISVADLDATSDERWLRVYIYLRIYETGSSWSQSQFDSFVKKTQAFYRKNNLQKAQRYVSLRFKDCKTAGSAKKDLTSGTIGSIVELPIKRFSPPIIF